MEDISHIKVSTANRDVLRSGSIIVHHGEQVVFDFPRINAKVIADFQNNGEKQTRFTVNEEKDALRLTIFNTKNALPIASTNPIRLGVIDNRPLTISFMVTCVGSEPSLIRLFNYTWFLGGN